VKAAVAEAHELGLKVTVDAETFYIQRAVEAGADTTNIRCRAARRRFS